MKAIPDVDTLEAVAHAGQTSVGTLREAWPTWVKQLIRAVFEITRRTHGLDGYADNPPSLP